MLITKMWLLDCRLAKEEKIKFGLLIDIEKDKVEMVNFLISN